MSTARRLVPGAPERLVVQADEREVLRGFRGPEQAGKDDDPKAPSSREQSPVFKHRVVRVVDERYRFPVPSINLTETGYSRRIKEVFLRAPAEI
ncbi:hypothetical protein [Methanoculleus receptaculi]|uniref:Uncharacterized protein n=1 Tax=Methanoculleus receptaculi TaxID=394967 RepID=A0AAX4FUZ8_9EURY|nr:hypothetical protein [Methanoculleus receptaculi]WOX56971.1 hypothetical protein R6Y96_06535 [Methanoculleus receptaculi]